MKFEHEPDPLMNKVGRVMLQYLELSAGLGVLAVGASSPPSVLSSGAIAVGAALTVDGWKRLGRELRSSD